jgi:hypothetical protein
VDVRRYGLGLRRIPPAGDWEAYEWGGGGRRTDVIVCLRKGDGEREERLREWKEKCINTVQDDV